MGWNGLRGPELTWRTELDVEECERRLDETVDTESHQLQSFTVFGTLPWVPIRGKVDVPAIRLQKGYGYRNSFAPPLFNGSLEADPAGRGTTLTGRFSMNPAVKVFIGIAVVFPVSIVVSLLAERGSAGGVSELLPILLLPAAGLVILAYGKWLGKSDEKYLVDFIEKTLEAKQVTR